MLNNDIKIPSSKEDDTLLTIVTSKVSDNIKSKYFNDERFPSNWNFECADAKLPFNTIKDKLLEKGMSPKKVNNYYNGTNGIVTDAHIIYLTIKNGNNIKKYPVFMGEMKKQGTNDERIKLGLSKQAIGNAGPDRVAKNFTIAADYCFLCNNTIFPYNVFLHGCDFGEDITSTTKSKLTPFFGKLNTFNPYFDKDIFWARKGGSCYYQKEDFTYEQLYNYCYKCCIECIEYYLNNYKGDIE